VKLRRVILPTRRRAKTAGRATLAHLDAVLDRLIAFERGRPIFRDRVRPAGRNDLQKPA
jgi:hypothetical protein